jgi:cell wall-associated NlpC family hydrolase
MTIAVLAPHFEDDQIWARMDQIARSWLGTPYKHITCVKGRGADCTLFIGACWVEGKILRTMEYYYYPKEWYIHATKDTIVESLYRHFEKHASSGFGIAQYKPEETELMRGDLLTFAIHSPRQITNHAAMYMGDEKVIHASPSKGVVLVPFSHYLKPKVTNIFRVMRQV